MASHFGRHWFTTYWRTEQNLQHELLQYMRGDRVSGHADSLEASSIDPYLHIYYEDIEDRYRQDIYTLCS